MAAGVPASWKVLYHPAVRKDLDSLGSAASLRVMEAIHRRLHLGEPEKAGKPLGGKLSGWRRIRAAPFRIVYRIELRQREAYVLAIGPRRREEVYQQALRRT